MTAASQRLRQTLPWPMQTASQLLQAEKVDRAAKRKAKAKAAA
jgi:hypothetical protein